MGDCSAWSQSFWHTVTALRDGWLSCATETPNIINLLSLYLCHAISEAITSNIHTIYQAALNKVSPIKQGSLVVGLWATKIKQIYLQSRDMVVQLHPLLLSVHFDILSVLLSQLFLPYRCASFLVNSSFNCLCLSCSQTSQWRTSCSVCQDPARHQSSFYPVETKKPDCQSSLVHLVRQNITAAIPLSL